MTRYFPRESGSEPAGNTHEHFTHVRADLTESSHQLAGLLLRFVCAFEALLPSAIIGIFFVIEHAVATSTQAVNIVFLSLNCQYPSIFITFLTSSGNSIAPLSLP